MARGNSFGNFKADFKKDVRNFKVKPIMGEFGGAAPDSIYASNVQSVWARWRRGMELAAAHYTDTQLEYPFTYILPQVPGTTFSGPAPTIGGTFVGFPTVNKELGMHWAGSLNAGNLRFDQLGTTSGTATISGEIPTDVLFNGQPQINSRFWYIQINGNWSAANPLPAPLYVEIAIPGRPVVVLKPINGQALADRIIASGDAPITRESRDPQSNYGYGYTEAILADVDGHNGVLQLKKNGSVRATRDGVFVTPARVPPESGRYFMNGSRYCCSCQDYTQRDYFYASTIMGERKGIQFPYSSPAALKPGRYEMMKEQMSGVSIIREPLSNAAQERYNPLTSGIQNREMMIVGPSGYQVSGEINLSVTFPSGNRDFPGVFRDFGRQYIEQYGDNPNAVSPTYPKFDDYTSTSGVNGQPRVITTIEDYWFPTLDEARRCKHIYAMLYIAKLYGPEPSDYPVEEGSIVEWEEKLVRKTEKDQEKTALDLLRYGLSRMDTPPYNMQAPMMGPMLTKLFSLPSAFIVMDGMRMYGPDGGEYNPSSGETPATVERSQGF